MKGKLNEVAFTYHLPFPGECDWRQFVVRAGKLHGKLTWSFTVCGSDGADDVLPEELIEPIRDALTWAKTQVREGDIYEHERDDGCGQ